MVVRGSAGGNVALRVHLVPRFRSPNPCLPHKQDTICCKKQSYAPEYGQKIVWTCWADLVDQYIIVASSCFFYITLLTLMKHGQTQIKGKTGRCDRLNVKERRENVWKSQWISVYVRLRCKEEGNIGIFMAKNRTVYMDCICLVLKRH